MSAVLQLGGGGGGGGGGGKRKQEKEERDAKVGVVCLVFLSMLYHQMVLTSAARLKRFSSCDNDCDDDADADRQFIERSGCFKFFAAES